MIAAKPLSILSSLSINPFLCYNNVTMSLPVHFIRRCMRPTCRFRFPVGPGQPDRETCPKCSGPLQRVENPYTDLAVEASPITQKGPAVEALLDNIRSSFNVGAMFRTADGAGVRHLHLAGVTSAPDHPKVGKTALGAEYAVPWTLHWDAVAAAQECKQQGMRLWALEGGPDAGSLVRAGLRAGRRSDSAGGRQ